MDGRVRLEAGENGVELRLRGTVERIGRRAGPIFPVRAGGQVNLTLGLSGGGRGGGQGQHDGNVSHVHPCFFADIPAGLICLRCDGILRQISKPD
jgi:hypothetical protein